MKNLILLAFIFIGITVRSQNSGPDLVGYWHNWNDANAPYLQLPQIDSRYTVIEIAFATPAPGTHASMQFSPSGTTQTSFITDLQILQSQGKKVLISIGGATDPVSLLDTNDRNTFVSTMLDILNTYNFDGIDIDLEGSSLSTSGGTISNPTDPQIVLLIEAIRAIMLDYQIHHGKRLMLTMAPETAFVQGGMSAFGGIWGAYLPVIEALKDSIEILQVQLYNSGSMFGLDGNIYTQGTADFIVAMTEAVIRGFNTSGGTFSGIPSNHVAIGLPACPSAAGGGYVSPAVVQSAVNYLRGTGPQAGNYTLQQNGGYPDLRGMMTWSINWDAVSTCASTDEYAINYETIFSVPTGTGTITDASVELGPNPVNNLLYLNRENSSLNGEAFHIYNSYGELCISGMLNKKHETIDLGGLSSGIYLLQSEHFSKKLIKE